MSFTSISEQSHAHYEPGVPYEVSCPQGSVFELLEHSAQTYPDAVAIDYFGAEWTYQRFFDEARKGAQVLTDLGIAKDDVVSFALPNCPQHLIAFYAAMYIGATVAELNPLAPATQVREQIARHGGTWCVAWEKSVGTLVSAGVDPAHILTVDITAPMPRSLRLKLRLPVAEARKQRQAMRAPVPRRSLSWDGLLKRAGLLTGPVSKTGGGDVAVVLHSSGTNGVPKSVPITHANLRANVNQNLFWVPGLDRGAETFFSLLPYFHAFGMCFQVCSSVAIGACQVVLPTFSPALALEAHRRRNVTFFLGVPPMFDRISKYAVEHEIDISSIEFAVSGGMSLSREIAQRWEESTGNYIIEGYGMSETSPTLCGSPLSAERRPGCLGLVFPSTNMRLVDQNDPSVDVPDGEPGEILVKGPQVFTGYLNDPEETAKAFVDGWFRTGDIGRNDDGFIYLVDRSKDLIITSGFNVFPSHVEEAIRKLTNVDDVVVVGVPDGAAGERVAAVVVAPWKKPDLARLRATLEKELPHYALPRELHVVESIPRSLIGKVERREVRDRLIAAGLTKKVTDWRVDGSFLEESRP
ncbi:MAG: AMP-binding protein [Ancrocorticia sp.]